MEYKSEKELKEELQRIKENNWKLPEGTDAYKLCLDMMHTIGTLDSYLRDQLILTMLCTIIEEKLITYKEMRELLALCLSDEHLFCGVGSVNEDSVFNRTFTACTLESIIHVANDAGDELLSEEEILDTYKKVMEYYRKEIDYRGYVIGKGWADSNDHAAYLLQQYARSKYLGYEEFMDILSVIKEKTYVNSYTFVDEEEESFISIIMEIYNRHVIKDEELIKWINGFDHITKIGKLPEDQYLRQNVKLFVRNLYFRFKKYDLSEDLIGAVYEVVKKLTPSYY